MATTVPAMRSEDPGSDLAGLSPHHRRRRLWGQMARAGFALSIIANVIESALDPQGTWFVVMRTAFAALFTVGVVLSVAFWWLARRERERTAVATPRR